MPTRKDICSSVNSKGTEMAMKQVVQLTHVQHHRAGAFGRGEGLVR